MDKKYSVDVEAVISQILEFCNKMPLDREGRQKLAEKLIEEHITTDPSEAWKEPQITDADVPSD